jgi:hypothetical protein
MEQLQRVQAQLRAMKPEPCKSDSGRILAAVTDDGRIFVESGRLDRGEAQRLGEWLAKVTA